MVGGTVELYGINIENNRISYTYNVKGKVEKYFLTNKDAFAEYSLDVSMVPKSIAVIPFIANILPIIWICDAELVVRELDEQFYNALNEVKKALSEMYQGVQFKGKLTCNNICDNDNNAVDGKVATFYSGGVDSHATLLRNLGKTPELITIWGADVDLLDHLGWNKIKHHIDQVAGEYSIKNGFIKSSFREYISQDRLNEDFQVALNDGWWHGVQHGLAMIGLTAPYTYCKGIDLLLVPSTHHEDEANVKCASYPTIDNSIKYHSTSVYHDGFELTRQHKIDLISNSKDCTNLRVCWEASGGGNCCTCEKCIRTITGFLVAGVNPIDYGFDRFDFDFNRIEIKLKYKWILSDQDILFWKNIQESAFKILKEESGVHNVGWIKNVNFDKINNNVIKRLRVLKRKITR